MNTYQHYKGIKARLNSVAPVFYYLGQYLKGADQTSYKVPAIYIEMPKYLPIVYFNRVIKTSKNAQFKVHVINNAPFKGNDSSMQDSALQAHENLKKQVTDLLQGYILKDANSLLLTQQMIEVASSNLNYDGAHVYSIITYQCDFHDRT